MHFTLGFVQNTAYQSCGDTTVISMTIRQNQCDTIKMLSLVTSEIKFLMTLKLCDSSFEYLY